MHDYSSLLDDERILLEVFARLPLNEIVKCRNVCRSWREMIDLNMKFKHFVVHTDARPCHRWSFDGRPLNTSDMLRVHYLNPFLRSTLTNSLFSSLQRLFIYCHCTKIRDRDFNLNSLNEFTELRQLEIIPFKPELRKTGYKLTLKKLELLTLRFARDRIWKKISREAIVELDTPRLRIIIGDFECLAPKHPEAIKILEVEQYGSRNFEPLYELVNLEYLYIRWITWMRDDFLLKLPMLKAIQFASPASRCSDVFTKLHSQKRRLGMKQLKIQFLGIALEESEFPYYDLDPSHSSHFNSKTQLRSSYAETKFCNELDEELNERNYKLYFTHSSRLAPIIAHVTRLQFRLVELNPDKRLFFRRFPNICEIVLNHKLTKPQLFFEFIHTQGTLRSLKFDGSGFGQSRFDVLSQYVPLLSELRILNEPGTLYFGFVLSLPNLILLKTDQFISFEVLRQLCSRCQVDSVFHFCYHSNRIEITCDGRELCSLDVCGPLGENQELIQDVVNLDGLLIDLEELIRCN